MKKCKPDFFFVLYQFLTYNVDHDMHLSPQRRIGLQKEINLGKGKLMTSTKPISSFRKGRWRGTGFLSVFGGGGGGVYEEGEYGMSSLLTSDLDAAALKTLNLLQKTLV